MFQVILYTAENNSLKTYRTVTFNTYLAASEFVDKFAAIDLDEFEDSDELVLWQAAAHTNITTDIKMQICLLTMIICSYICLNTMPK